MYGGKSYIDYVSFYNQCGIKRNRMMVQITCSILDEICMYVCSRKSLTTSACMCIFNNQLRRSGLPLASV